eukprot:31431-Pelagococcus_subviridis.AAC.11
MNALPPASSPLFPATVDVPSSPPAAADPAAAAGTRPPPAADSAASSRMSIAGCALFDPLLH